jgi:hypothetical protein
METLNDIIEESARKFGGKERVHDPTGFPHARLELP